MVLRRRTVTSVLVALFAYFPTASTSEEQLFALNPPEDGWMGMAMAHTVEVIDQMAESSQNTDVYRDYRSKYLKWLAAASIELAVQHRKKGFNVEASQHYSFCFASVSEAHRGGFSRPPASMGDNANKTPPAGDTLGQPAMVDREPNGATMFGCHSRIDRARSSGKTSTISFNAATNNARRRGSPNTHNSNGPLIIGPGLLDGKGWHGAMNKWTRTGFSEHYGDVKFRTSLVPQPGDDVDEAWAKWHEREGWILDPTADPAVYVKSDSDGSGGSAEDENNDTTHPTKPVPDFVRQHAKAWNLNLRLVSTSTLAEFVESVMETPTPINSSATGFKYIFNTIEGTHPLKDDFAIPEVLEQVAALYEANTGHREGMFDFSFGSGAHAHVHRSAWNALVRGRKQWVLFPADVLSPEGVSQNMPALEWFRTHLPKLRNAGMVVEFVQEAGEVVLVPDNWGHAVLNLEPSIGVAKQMGSWDFKVPNVVQDFVAGMGSY
eukprot:gene7432-22514_t